MSQSGRSGAEVWGGWRGGVEASPADGMWTERKILQDEGRAAEVYRAGTGACAWVGLRYENGELLVFQESYDLFPGFAECYSTFPVDILRVQIHLNGFHNQLVKIS